MKILIAAFAALSLTAGAFAEVKATSNLTEKEKEQRFLKRTGGFVKDTRKQKGCVAIVNCQNEANEKWLANAANVFSGQVEIDVKVVNGSFNLSNPELQGEVSVFVVNDPTLPISLVAPESRWSVVNVARLKTEKRAFFETRTMKAIVRAIVPLLGGSDSSFDCCLMSNVLKAEDYDRFPDAKIQYDIIDRFKRNLKGLGIAPYAVATYKQACKEGWAPAPTNDVQKAVWEKVHTPPTKPLKITFDPAAQKPVVK